MTRCSFLGGFSNWHRALSVQQVKTITEMATIDGHLWRHFLWQGPRLKDRLGLDRQMALSFGGELLVNWLTGMSKRQVCRRHWHSFEFNKWHDGAPKSIVRRNERFYLVSWSESFCNMFYRYSNIPVLPAFRGLSLSTRWSISKSVSLVKRATGPGNDPLWSAPFGEDSFTLYFGALLSKRIQSCCLLEKRRSSSSFSLSYSLKGFIRNVFLCLCRYFWVKKLPIRGFFVSYNNSHSLQVEDLICRLSSLS